MSAGSALLTIVVGGTLWLRSPSSDLAVNASLVSEESTSLRTALATREIVPPKSATQEKLERDYPIPAAIDAKYPSLGTWLHPVAEAEEKYPWFPPRRFGAKRSGIQRRECGRGHCGLDLHAPRGTPILAVAPGVIVKLEHRASGGDGMSGRYVRIQHDDGALTAYMHLDSITRGLDMDMRVEAGQQIGTLGSTGVQRSNPHLHFALELPRKDNSKNWINQSKFIDPSPWLIRSKIAPKPQKPQRKKRDKRSS